MVSETLHTWKVSEPGEACGPERSVVTTRAASKMTPISRMDSPFFGFQRARDPDDDVLIFGGMEVHPAEGVLLGVERRGDGERGYQHHCGKKPEHNTAHVLDIADRPRWARLPELIRFHSPSFAQSASTRALVAASISIMAGHGRSKPSAFHLRVASMPILEP